MKASGGHHLSVWPLTPLSRLCTKISSGGTPSRKNSLYFAGEGHLWVKSKELLDRPIDSSEEKITDEAVADSAAKEYPPKTVLLAMYGANVGQLGFLRRAATINQAICGLIVDNKVADPRYVFYALLYCRKFLTTKAFGAAQQNLNQALVRSFEIPSPPIEVQRRIVAVLSACDDLIENNIHRIRLLEDIARAVFTEWFAKFQFPGHEHARFTDTAAGELPDDWRYMELGNLAIEVRDAVRPAEVDPETPYIGLEHIPRRSLALLEWGKAADATSTKLKFVEGDVLFGKIRPYFHKVVVAPFDGICSSDTIVLRARDEKRWPLAIATAASDEFVKHATQTSQGTKMPRANWDVLKKYAVLIPSDALLQRFHSHMSSTVKLIQNLTMTIVFLRRTRDMILPKLVSGELDVSDLDIKMEEDQQ